MALSVEFSRCAGVQGNCTELNNLLPSRRQTEYPKTKFDEQIYGYGFLKLSFFRRLAASGF
ncbi:hypothetical protein PGT21_006354 [Puccinia graminis f. sp. tritici]|uniref:Uncharacterized protein n=1 Tax=Puccinia graminis f. sp. tritici TaxID=56615 RepID=A0A5B0QNB4_PUCGR|nr:hypothetical protein PGT21_006354 [Puccinia graminis f. sp. tritici]